jgi:hypothetical protein
MITIEEMKTAENLARELLAQFLDNREKYTITHDDKHTVEEWAEIISDYAGQIPFYDVPGNREQFKKIAMVAFAAMLAIDRKQEVNNDRSTGTSTRS